MRYPPGPAGCAQRARLPSKNCASRSSYFFLRLGDTMRDLICWCPRTQRPIDLQLFTDYATLARIWSNSVRFHCPHCGADHETKVGAACLQTTLARTASSQTHEASELEENTEVHPQSTAPG